MKSGAAAAARSHHPGVRAPAARRSTTHWQRSSRETRRSGRVASTSSCRASKRCSARDDLQPRPVQVADPLTIGGNSRPVLRDAALYADRWNTYVGWQLSPEEGRRMTAERNAYLDELCVESGRRELRRRSSATSTAKESRSTSARSRRSTTTRGTRFRPTASARTWRSTTIAGLQDGEAHHARHPELPSASRGREPPTPPVRSAGSPSEWRGGRTCPPGEYGPNGPKKRHPTRCVPRTPSRVKKRKGRRASGAAHPELIGLGLVALGLFLSVVLLLGWDGGAVGDRRRPTGSTG